MKSELSLNDILNEIEIYNEDLDTLKLVRRLRRLQRLCMDVQFSDDKLAASHILEILNED
jgi:hypothetical protein